VRLTPERWPKRDDIYAIGITGNIASGKSVVDAMLAAKGAEVMDADQVTRDLQRPGQPVLKAIVERFGPDVLTMEGELDRAKMGQIVFSDPEALKDLELLVHPAVREEERRRLEAARSGSVLVIDAIKLIESGMADSCDSVWAVTALFEAQMDRLQRHRGMSAELADQRIRAQPSQEEKIQRADVVIRNDGSLEDAQRQVDEAWERTAGIWLARRAQAPPS
jgi:dephospho-CoA kinase